MHERCGYCGLTFLREPGFFLGSIYFNYGVTALIVTAAYLSLFFFAGVSPTVLLWSLAAFCLIFPLWFFRYARSLWLGMDQYFDPRAGESQETGVRGQQSGVSSQQSGVRACENF